MRRLLGLDLDRLFNFRAWRTGLARVRNVRASAYRVQEARPFRPALESLEARLVPASVAFISPGTTNWTAPTGVFSVAAEVWGGGGSGGTGPLRGFGMGTGGGGGGAFASATISVTPNTGYTVTVGAGGSGSSGGESWFDSSNTVMAVGGSNGVSDSTTAGAGGAASLSVGTTTYSGGSGGIGGGSSEGGGGGGGAAGSEGNGNAGNGYSGTTGGSGGTGLADSGAGGAGGNAGSPGAAGYNPGGGGGGTGYHNTGGVGGNGEVIITYVYSTDSVSLVTSNNSTVFGQSVSFMATINPGVSGVATPSGTVSFYDGTSLLATVAVNSSGVANYSTSSLPVGSHSITADYSGDTNFAACNSSAVSQTVSHASTNSVLAFSGSTVYGQAVTLTDTVSAVSPGSGNPSGTVTFYSGSTLLGTASLSTSGGVTTASLATSALPAGSDSVTADYAGDTNFSASDSSAVNQTVSQASTTSSVTSSGSVVYGQDATFTDTVSVTAPGSGTPTGSVTFYSGSTDLGSGTLTTMGGVTSATLSTDALGSPDSYSITADYTGDSNFLGSDAAACSQTVSAADTSTSVTSTGPVTYGQSVTITATVSPTSPGSGDPTGTVTFLDGSTSLGSGTLSTSGGLTTATFSTSGLAIGSHTITATYNGDSNFNSSTSDNLTQEVNNAPPSLTNPGTQNNSEGDTVSLAVQATDPEGATVNFGASGLPDGLTIDGSTGLISGTLSYTDAETQGGVYSVTVSVIDSNALSASSTFTWDVAHVTPTPTIASPGDQVNNVGDAVSISVADNSPTTIDYPVPLSYSASGLPSGLSVNSSSGVISGVLTDYGSNTVTATATEGTASASVTFTWNVTDIQIYSFPDQENLEGDTVSVAAYAWAASGSTLTYSASGLPNGLSIDSGSGLISGTLAAGTASETPYSVTVTAAHGDASASTSFAWTVDFIEVQQPNDQSNSVGDAVSLQVSASAIGGTLSYSASSLPTGLSINSTTGLISGTVSAGATVGSPYSVSVSASDGTHTSSSSFSWSVVEIDITDPGLQINSQGASVTLQLQASDPNSDSLSYSASNLPPGLSINSTTGLISGTIANTAGAASPYSVSVTATDGTDSATDSFTWDVDNAGLTVSNPGVQTSAEGDTVSVTITASGGAGSGYTYSASGLPLGLSIDSASGVISGTVDYTAAETNSGAYAVSVFADDGQGDTGSAAFAWTVTHTPQAPVISSPGDQLNNDGDVVSLQISAYDPDGNTLTYSASGLPAGLSIDSSSGIVGGTIGSTADSSSPYAVSVSASDGTLSSSVSFVWNVVNNQITVASPGDQTNAETDTVSLPISASSSDGLPLTYSASNLPTGLSIDSSTGVISGTISYGAAENGPFFSVIVTVSDSAGDNGGTAFNWSVQATPQAPTVVNPGSQTNAEGDVVSLQVQVNNPDGANLDYTASGLPIGLTINPLNGLISGTVSYGAAGIAGGDYAPTVYVNDGAGDTASASFTWTITRTDLGPWIEAPSDQIDHVGDSVSIPVSAGDQDGDSLTYSATDLPTGLSINSLTGQISGVITGAVANYLVMLSVTDGLMAAEQQFTLAVVANNNPKAVVDISIAGTDGHDNDVMILGATQPVPVVITLVSAEGANPHIVQLEIPSGLASLNETTLELDVGGSQTVYLTPEEASFEVDDLVIDAYVDGSSNCAGSQEGTIEKITLPTIRATDTPAAMVADRIPPKQPSNFAVTLSLPLLGTNEKVWLCVGNQDSGNGSVNISTANGSQYGGKWAYLQETGQISLVGVDQTTAGHAGQLALAAQGGSNDDDGIWGSSGFSVAAIPIKIEMGKPTPVVAQQFPVPGNPLLVGYRWGASYQIKVDSDSGDPTDLNEVKCSEVVKDGPGTGIFAGATPQPIVWFPPTAALPDVNSFWTLNGIGTPLASFVAHIQGKIDKLGNGSITSDQFFIFSDARTGVPANPNGAGAIIVPFSGFQISKLAGKTAVGKSYFVWVKRVGKANNGAAAGDNVSPETVPAQIQ